MQVTHKDDLDTHAMIGGRNVMAFGIAQTPEFFEVLSSTLYSNKPLAVIREVLCNGWDSHIVSGVTNVPLKITLNKESLIIRDYGKGIHPDLMQTIYCVYGASTKANDGNQTGGFGLGSKAPFAYATNFTVTTYHAGKKTVYAVSRGSKLTNGVPDLRIMVQVPTDEQGVEVNIPIKSPEDVELFKGIIESIASYGEMNVILNDKHIPIIPISSAENNLFLTRTNPRNHGMERIHVRYGNVVYPVPMHPDYQKYYKSILETLNKIPDTRYGSDTSNWHLIVQAPGNSISVTPSRETLSMTDTTIDTLKNILISVDNIANMKKKSFTDLFIEYHNQAIDQFFLKGEPQKLVWYKNIVSELNPTKSQPPEYITNIKDVAKFILSHDRTLPDSAYITMYKRILDVYIENNRGPKDIIIRMRKHLDDEENHEPYFYDYTKSRNPKFIKFRDTVLKHLIRVLNKEPDTDVKDMHVAYSYHGRNTVQGTMFSSILHPKVTTENQIKLMQGSVVLTTSKTAYAEDFAGDRNFRGNNPHFVYVVPKDKEKRDRIKTIFEKLGFYVIDFASHYIDVILPARAPDPALDKDGKPIPPVIRQKPKGIPTLTNLVSKGKYASFNMRGHRNDDPKNPIDRIESPEFIFQPHNLSSSRDAKFFSFGDSVIGTEIVNLFGSKGGVVTNIQQYDAFIKAGAKDGYMWLVNTLADYLIDNKIIEASRGFRPSINIRGDNYHHINQLIEIGKVNSFLNRLLKVPKPLTKEEEQYLNMYEVLRNKISLHSKADDWQGLFNKRFEHFEKVTVNPDYIALIDMVSMQGKYLTSLDLPNIKERFTKSDISFKERTFLEILVLSALTT